jgi:hypothetical protein
MPGLDTAGSLIRTWLIMIKGKRKYYKLPSFDKEYDSDETPTIDDFKISSTEIFDKNSDSDYDCDDDEGVIVE